MKSEWHFLVDGKQRGPVTIGGIRHQLQIGNLTNDSLVWRDGMPEWKSIRDIPEFESPKTQSIDVSTIDRGPLKKQNSVAHKSTVETVTEVLIFALVVGIAVAVWQLWPTEEKRENKIANAHGFLMNSFRDHRHEVFPEAYEVGAWYPIEINPENPETDTYVVRITIYSAEFLENHPAKADLDFPEGTEVYLFKVKKVIERQPVELVKSVGLPLRQELYATAYVTENPNKLGQQGNAFFVRLEPTSSLTSNR